MPDRLSITRPAFDKRENLSVWALAQETVNQRSRDKNPSPQLVGDLLRAILTGGPYPATLLNGVTLRIRAEREVTRGRAAILKAYYLRNYPTELNKEVFTVSLNESSNVPLCSGASLLCAGDDPERRQSRHQRHHQRPVLQLGLCHPRQRPSLRWSSWLRSICRR